MLAGRAAGSVNGDSSAAASLSTDGFATPLLGGSPAAHSKLQGAHMRRAATSPERLGGLPPGSPLKPFDQPLQPPAAQQEQQGEEAEEAEGSEEGGSSGPGGTAAGGLPEGLPPLLSPDFAANAFITRLAFDLLRRPDFQVLHRHRGRLGCGRSSAGMHGRTPRC